MSGIALLLAGGLSLGAPPPIAIVPTAELPADTTIVLHAAGLFDAREGGLVRDAVVAVRNGRIVAAGPRATTTSPGDGPVRTIELGSAMLLPGLVDAHVHLVLGGGSPEANALATLRAGFTTVQDLGGGAIPLRDSIRAGAVPGPRVLAAGPWIGTRGGTCDFSGNQPAHGSVVARVEDVLGRGPDVIKLCVTGWVTDAISRPDSVEIHGEELAASVAAAHAGGRKAVAHAIGEAGARLAVQAGMDALVHAAFLDPATEAEMARRGTFLIPTLASLQGAGAGLGARVARAYAAGVPLAFGTDAGVLPHGENAREFAALVAAGVPPAAALRAATLGAAEPLGPEGEIGSLEPGKVADLIAVDGDPLEDPAALGRVVFVMQGGRVVVEAGP